MPKEKKAEDDVDPMDNEATLKDWGFDNNRCFRCGVHNSLIDGLLMQCGKCKKAYYCSMACFNNDLENHQKFCKTDKIHHQPKRRGPPANLVRADTDDMEEAYPEPEPEPEPKEEPEPEVETEDDASSVHELHSVTSEEEQADEEEEEEELEDQTPPVSPETAEEKRQRKLKLNQGYLPESPTYEKESVALRKAQQNERPQYEWDKPDWARNSPLRTTSKGMRAKTQGNLAKPVTQINTLIEKGEIKKHTPEWAASPRLKKTPYSEKVKAEGAPSSPELQEAKMKKADVGWQKPDWVTNSPIKKKSEKVDEPATGLPTLQSLDLDD